MATTKKTVGKKRFKGIEVTWFGHSFFNIKFPDGKVVIIDPWVDNPKAPESAKNIEKADLILITHGHFDHVGSAPEIAQKTGAKVVSIFEVSRYIASRGVPEDQIIGMNISGTVDIDGVKVSMVPAVHSSGISDATGGLIEGGNPCGFVIEFPNKFKVYHTGDTGIFGDMALIRRLYSPDLVLICIGGFYTMGSREAAEAVKILNPKFVIPMHYGTFPVLAGTPDELKKYLPPGLRKRVVVLNPGETAT